MILTLEFDLLCIPAKTSIILSTMTHAVNEAFQFVDCDWRNFIKKNPVKVSTLITLCIGSSVLLIIFCVDLYVFALFFVKYYVDQNMSLRADTHKSVIAATMDISQVFFFFNQYISTLSTWNWLEPPKKITSISTSRIKVWSNRAHETMKTANRLSGHCVAQRDACMRPTSD